MSSEVNGSRPAASVGIEHLNALYSYAMALTRNQAEAEDLVQETYARALPAAARLREKSNVRGWLFKILRNIWLNQLRKRRTNPQIVDLDASESAAGNVVDPGKRPYDIYVGKLESDQIRAAIEKLPAELREIILLREFEELAYMEIAEVLGCPAGTVMSRLSRARLKLRSILSDTSKQAATALQPRCKAKEM